MEGVLRISHDSAGLRQYFPKEENEKHRKLILHTHSSPMNGKKIFLKNHSILFLVFYIFQSIGSSHQSTNIELIAEKGLLPKNPLWAEKGDGWADSRTTCFSVSISLFLLRAKFPQKTKITCSFCSEIWWITKSVKFSHPIFSWLAGRHDCTLKIELRRNTPWSAQRVRFPCDQREIPRSWCNSWKILRKLGGIFTHFATEKLIPWACPGAWYGSCPSITTRILQKATLWKMENIFSKGGNIFTPSRRSETIFFRISWK